MAVAAVTVRADDLADVLDRALSLPLAEHPHWKRTARLAAALKRVGVAVERAGCGPDG